MGETKAERRTTALRVGLGVAAALLFCIQEPQAAPELPHGGGRGPELPEPEPAPLRDVDTDLDAVLERGALENACAGIGPTSTRRERLLCGKSMFFYETFGTGGVPRALVAHLSQHYPSSLGLGMSKLGMVRDPASPDDLPLGLAATTPIKGHLPAVAFTCASCHFARLADGRYAVGAPNHGYQYGAQITALTLYSFTVPTAAGIPLPGLPRISQEAQAILEPIVAERKRSLSARISFAETLVAVGGTSFLLGVPIPPMPEHVQRHYAAWRTGTMDFLIDPLPADDHVHTVSKIPGLFALPTARERERAHMPSAYLGYAGVAPSILSFLKSFVSYGAGDTAAWTDERFAPLVEYLHSLKAPLPMAPPDALAVRFGRALFVSKGCADCHDGPHGESTRLFTFDEIGTDPALMRWRDPDLTGHTYPTLPPTPDQPVTHKLKAPRLAGLWTASRFLHNGSLDTLEQLFCREPRTLRPPPFGTQGHRFTCEGLTDPEKDALVAYLESL